MNLTSFKRSMLTFLSVLETRAVDDKEYNLQDNKEDMQIIDDVEASTSDGSGLNEDDILSHAGSDIDDLSSMSGSFSRSKSPLSGRSRSRSRSASRGSSGKLSC